MKKNAFIIIICAFIVGIGIIILNKPPKTAEKNPAGVQNSEIKNGTQYITINAKAGYSPKVSTAKSGIPTKLIVKTNGTYDCSVSLVIHSINYQKILQPTGEGVIDIGTPVAGIPLRGVCSMGMYNFSINFI